MIEDDAEAVALLSVLTPKVEKEFARARVSLSVASVSVGVVADGSIEPRESKSLGWSIERVDGAGIV